MENTFVSMIVLGTLMCFICVLILAFNDLSYRLTRFIGAIILVSVFAVFVGFLSLVIYG